MADDPARLAASGLAGRAGRGPSVACWPTRPGPSASTTTSSSSIPWSPPGPTPPCCASPLRACGRRPAPSRAVWRLSTDGSPRWCALDPRAGTRLVVAESALNVACAGARPVALVNCLNFGNPEHPEVMWQLSEAIDGMAEACTALGIPVVGGNVSLYNESNGTDIHPTPVVGTLGLIDRPAARHPDPGLRAGSSRGAAPARPAPVPSRWPASRWAAERRGHLGGHLPALDLELHARLLRLVAALVDERLVDGVHDVSDGGSASPWRRWR